jgi:hypothetical protein
MIMAGKNQYNCKKLFPISKPYGYEPRTVEETIDKYNALILKQKNIIIKMKNENAALKNEINNLESELKNMQMELSFADIPSVNDIQESYIIDRFERNISSDEPVPPAAPAPAPQAPPVQPVQAQPVQAQPQPQQYVAPGQSMPPGEKKVLSEVEMMLADLTSDTSTSSDSVFDIPEYTGPSEQAQSQQQPVQAQQISRNPQMTQPQGRGPQRVQPQQDMPTPVESEPQKPEGMPSDEELFNQKFGF